MHKAKDSIARCLELSQSFGVIWTRERMIEHWQILLTRSFRYPIVHQFALQALANLRAEREPGQDDEELFVKAET